MIGAVYLKQAARSTPHTSAAARQAAPRSELSREAHADLRGVGVGGDGGDGVGVGIGATVTVRRSPPASRREALETIEVEGRLGALDEYAKAFPERSEVSSASVTMREEPGRDRRLGTGGRCTK